ncbi:MAG: hypothetical protein QOG50_3622, partial [Actinomycetota bacterium]|nr:hypothetical protein [Actinomycetota bacterium]
VIEWLELQPMITLRKPARVPLDDIGLEIAEAFFEASGGNPNVLGLVIRDSYDLERRVSMDDDGHWRAQGDLDSLRRSQSAEKLIRARLARLNSDERELLDVASVAGLEIDGDLVRRVSRRDLDDVNRLLGTAVTRHFISEADGVARFETEATRRAIYRIMSTATRARWHEAIAYALRERASDGRMLVPDVQIARHFSAVAAMDGRHAPDAANHFLRAARRAIRTEPGDAVSLAHEALAVVDKFELVDDGQLRAEAGDIVAAAQRELSYAESQVAPGSADELHAMRRGTRARR